MEVGYLRTPTGNALCPAARCEPDYLRTLAAEVHRTRLAVMVRPGEVDPAALAPLGDLGVGLVRVLAPGLDLVPALPYLAAARDAGLLTAVNLTHTSRADPARLALAVSRAAQAGAGLVYLADSNGSLYPEDVTRRVSAAVHAATEQGPGPVIGFHAHDNLGLAFANSCAALDAGATALDASIGGIGKGGGNLRLELIAAHLTLHLGADFSLDPLVKDQSTVSTRIRMLAEFSAENVLSGLLDVSLDQSRLLREQTARHGYDALLRGQSVLETSQVAGQV